MKINFEEMKEKGIFDYVSNHGWNMSKTQLVNLCKELSYAAYESDKPEYKSYTEPEAIKAFKDLELEENAEDYVDDIIQVV